MNPQSGMLGAEGRFEGMPGGGAAPAAGTGTARVAVVDDNPAKRYIAARWLQRAGFEVLEGSTGHDALQLAEHAHPDLFILDVRLPDMSGFEVCRRIRESNLSAYVPILHLSAHVTTPEDRAEGLEGGADAYLTHPVEAEELVATVRALLRIRRTEAALRASEERYRLVARATNDVIWDWDLRTGDLQWNDAARLLFRRRPEEIGPTAQWWYDQIHPDDRPRVVAGLRAVIDGAGELWLDEYRVRRGDGSWATVYDRGFVAHDELRRPVRMIGSMLDITERKRAEEARELLAGVSHALGQSMDSEATLARFAQFVCGRFADVCVVFTTDGSAGLLRAAELVGPAPLLEVLHEAAARPELLAEATIALGHGAATLVTSEGTMALSGVSTAWLGALGLSSGVWAPLRAADQTLGIVLFARDAASLRYGPRDVALAEELAGTAAMATHNAQLYERERIASRAKSDFLAVMSHELRTPLNAVIGYADLLLMGLPQSLTPQSTQYVERMRMAARHLLQLIEQILTYSRMEAGREQVHPEPVEVAALCRDMSSLLEPLAHEKGIEFRLVCDVPEGTTVVTDVGKVRQIVLNLLSNALKFTTRGSVTLRAAADAEEVRFEVADSGIGIAPEHLGSIFDPFWQVEQRMTRTVGGSGLGLTVSRRLARILGGDLHVESQLGQGSRFSLSLPIHFAAAAITRPALRSEATRREG